MKPTDKPVFVIIERKDGHIHLMDNGRLSIFRTRYNAEDWIAEWQAETRFDIKEMRLDEI